jgi:putative spermidine/putrescine transport system substrate-binding protein
MQDKQFMKEMLTEGAHAYKEGRMDRRSFLALCGGRLAWHSVL